jgi:serine/threonine protein kinase/tetratricopeptide (TPR) repeat protein
MSLHQRAKEIFLGALDRPAGERQAYVGEACAGDEALRREVEELLAFHGETTGGRASGDEPTFAPGEVVAGRYRMIARIGRGGMGDVWRADDLVLKTPVALKLLYSTDPADRERILHEVRVSRQITHPAVCRVFDVGEAKGGIVFYSMELVRGEDLAGFLKRVGRLPSEKVIDIARQLCEGLAAAHAQGVLHRDLKPANVLIDNEGRVRITDFGIAVLRADATGHTFAGTPAYMAPEQRAPGTRLSERTDIYSLGLVLYELLIGQHVAQSRDDGSSGLPLPSRIVPDVNPHLERAVMQALSPDPADRPASASEFADRLLGTVRRPITARPLPGVGSSRWLTWPVAVAAIGSVAGVLVLASSFFTPASTLTEQDTIVIADFENTTGEPVFDGAMKVALAVALEQSPFLKVFPDDRARETLRLMQRSPDERITRAIAREIARREQLKALLAGSIARLGRTYVIALEAINAETGDVMDREQAEAASQEEVLQALGELASRLRENLGESLASIQRFDVPLARATTPSLEALNAYSLALHNGREVPRLEAIPHLKRAIELDPNFAMGHALMSEVYANTEQSALAPPFARKAFELRDRVSERERFFISWRYYRDALQAADKALELAHSWTATYPREPFAFNSLGVAYIRIGQFEQSLAPLREAIRLDPGFSPPYANLAGALLALGRYGDARAILEEAADRQIEFGGARRLSYLLAFVEGDTETMDRELKASIGVRNTNAALGWEAQTAGFRGRLKEAHDQFRQGIQLSLQGGFREVAAQMTVDDAEMHAVVGQCAEAFDEVGPALALSRDNASVEQASRVLALCGDEGQARRLSNELARQFPDATLTMRLARPVTAAILALKQGQPAAALELLEPVRQYDHAPTAKFWPRYLRGQAYLELGDGMRAAAEFKSILDSRGEVPSSMLYPLAHLGMARATADTDSDASRNAYESFLALWSNADDRLTPLEAARAELSRLE